MMDIELLDNYFDEKEKNDRKRKELDKKRKHLGEKRHFKGDLRDLTKNRMLKRKDYSNLLFNAFDKLSVDLVKCFNNEKCKIDMDDLKDLVLDKRFCEAFIDVCDVYVEEEYDIPDVYMYMISYFATSNIRAFKNSKNIKKYAKLYRKVNKKKLEKLEKELKGVVAKDERKDTAMKLCLLAQTYRGDKKHLKRSMVAVSNEICNLGSEELNKKKVKSILFNLYKSKYFKKKFVEVSLTMSNNFKGDAPKNRIFDLISEIVMDILNEMDKDEMKDVIKRYKKSRENRNDRRRMNLLDGSKGYKNLHKYLVKQVEFGTRKEIFM